MEGTLVAYQHRRRSQFLKRWLIVSTHKHTSRQRFPPSLSVQHLVSTAVCSFKPPSNKVWLFFFSITKATTWLSWGWNNSTIPEVSDKQAQYSLVLEILVCQRYPDATKSSSRKKQTTAFDKWARFALQKSLLLSRAIDIVSGTSITLKPMETIPTYISGNVRVSQYHLYSKIVESQFH